MRYDAKERVMGFEPTTTTLATLCSSQLSYTRNELPPGDLTSKLAKMGTGKAHEDIRL